MITILAACGIARLRVDDDLRSLVRSSAAEFRILDEVAEQFGGPDRDCIVRAVARSGDIFDEAPLAAEVAKRYGARHVVRTVDRAEFEAELPAILEAMDLPSIECLEEALAECPCAMILVSHDRTFLDKLTDYTWNLEMQEDGATVKLVIGRREAAPIWDPDIDSL